MAGILLWGGDGQSFGRRLGGVGDSGRAIGVNLRQRAQKQAADVGENSGTARRDTVLSQELKEVAEGKIDALRGLEALEIRDEVEVVIGGLLLFLFGAMLRTEAGSRVGSGETALAAAGSAVEATKGDGICRLWFHFRS